MRDSKLIVLLSCFEAQELRQLKLMAESPYFNNQEPVRKLLEFLLLYAPKFTHPKMTYANAFTYIYDGRSIQSDPQLAVSKVMSKLMGVVREFIFQLKMEGSPLLRVSTLIQFFTEKSLLDQVPKLFEEADELLEEIPFRNEFFFRQKLILEFDRSSFLNIIQDKSSPDYNLTNQNRALDAYYAISKLQTYCFAQNERSRINFEFDYAQMDHFMHWLEESGLLDDFSIKTWYNALKILSDPNAAHYQALKACIDQYHTKLDPPVIRVLYSYLVNKAQEIFPDRNVFLKEVFSLYKEQMALGTLYISGYIAPTLVRNITIVGIKRREFDWVEDFLEKNAGKIVPTYLEREDIIHLCRAYLYFAKGEFQRTLDVINMLRYDSLFTKMDERRLRLMCYFEMGIQGPLGDLINSFRKFLADHKKKIPAGYLEANRMFIYYVHKISSTVFSTKAQRKALADEILQVAILPDKEWLLAKIEAA